MVAPVLEELSKEYAGKINIFKIDTEAEQELASAFGIRSIPSMLFCQEKAAANGCGSFTERRIEENHKRYSTKRTELIIVVDLCLLFLGKKIQNETEPRTNTGLCFYIQPSSAKE